MKKTFKRIGFFLLVIITIIVYSGMHLDIPREELERKYAIGASQFLDLSDGARVHFRDEGEKGHPVIVLLHGFNGSLFNFEHLVPFLIDDFRLVSIDLPGFGLTGAIPSAVYNTQSFMDTVTTVTSYLDIQKFSIAGNSMGGRVAWQYAIEFPDKVLGLVLIASSGVMTNEDRNRIEERKNNFPIVWRLLGSKFIKNFLLLYTPKFFATQGLKIAVYDQKLASTRYAKQFHELTLMEGSREAILSMERGEERKTDAKILSKIKAPTLALFGAEDKIVPLASSVQFKENVGSIEIKVYENIGHLPMYEDPKKTAEDISNFLKNKNI